MKRLLLLVPHLCMLHAALLCQQEMLSLGRAHCLRVLEGNFCRIMGG